MKDISFSFTYLWSLRVMKPTSVRLTIGQLLCPGLWKWWEYQSSDPPPTLSHSLSFSASSLLLLRFPPPSVSYIISLTSEFSSVSVPAINANLVIDVKASNLDGFTELSKQSANPSHLRRLFIYDKGSAMKQKYENKCKLQKWTWTFMIFQFYF